LEEGETANDDATGEREAMEPDDLFHFTPGPELIPDTLFGPADCANHHIQLKLIHATSRKHSDWLGVDLLTSCVAVAVAAGRLLQTL
jgi:hypothetical protein